VEQSVIGRRERFDIVVYPAQVVELSVICHFLS
jgi:hypothetical protein